jgi:thiol-disulfide isomerase/thioredoxin
MSTEVITRAGWALTIMILGAAAFSGWNRLQLRRLGQSAGKNLPGLEQLRPGVASVLYFYSPDCVPCRSAQRPALERLQSQMGQTLQVIEVDAAANTAIADHWGVLSVPTTFVIDPQGQPRRVNHGVASSEKLLQQLTSM